MKIWQTYRCFDDGDGRGPMVPHITFLHKEHAEKYIDNQPGVMGRRAKWSQEKYGDWCIKETEVYDYDVIEADQERTRRRMAVLAKLTPEEKDLLGIY